MCNFSMRGDVLGGVAVKIVDALVVERSVGVEIGKLYRVMDRIVSVRGKIYPDTSFGSLPFDVIICAEGAITPVGCRAELRVSTGSDISRRILKIRARKVGKRAKMRSAGELREIVFPLDGDSVVWGPLDQRDSLAVRSRYRSMLVTKIFGVAYLEL